MFMSPAKTSCPKKWTMEYNGFLMSDHINHKRTTFESVDKGLEGIYGSVSDQNGGLFYNGEVNCNGMDCPPFFFLIRS